MRPTVPVRRVERVARADTAAEETSQRLFDYDSQNLIVAPSTCAGEDRPRSSRRRGGGTSTRVGPDGAPVDKGEARRLAEALAEYTATSAEPFDDWSTVGFIYDSIDDYARSGAAFLLAARARGEADVHETAARGYEEAARRLELHALMDTTGLERGRRAAAQRVLPVPRGHRARGRAELSPWRPAADERRGVARRRRGLFAAAWSRLDEEPDFDEMITHGAVVSPPTTERLRLQWRTLSGFVALERGRASSPGATTSTGCAGRRSRSRGRSTPARPGSAEP